MTQTCKNCLNAYNSPHTTSVCCCNKEFLGQFQSVDTTVRPDETCGTWSPRRATQPPLVFGRAVQLTLF